MVGRSALSPQRPSMTAAMGRSRNGTPGSAPAPGPGEIASCRVRDVPRRLPATRRAVSARTVSAIWLGARSASASRRYRFGCRLESVTEAPELVTGQDRNGHVELAPPLAAGVRGPPPCPPGRRDYRLPTA